MLRKNSEVQVARLVERLLDVLPERAAIQITAQPQHAFLAQLPVQPNKTSDQECSSQFECDTACDTTPSNSYYLEGIVRVRGEATTTSQLARLGRACLCSCENSFTNAI